MALLRALAALCTPRDFTAMIAAVGLAQLAIVANYRRWLARPRPPLPPSCPPVSVIVPCKGQPEHIDYFDRNIASLLAQDYAGPLEFVFVCPSASDPAYLKLEALLEPRRDVRWRLLDSQAKPTRCGEKCLNLLYGVERVDPGTRVLAFTDCDMRFPKDWLRTLVGPLEDPALVAATAQAVELPFSPSFAQFLYITLVNGVAAADVVRPGVWGPSFALTKARFAELGIAEIWSRALTDDVSLRGLMSGFGPRLHYARAFPVCWQDGGFRSFAARHRKNFSYLRFEAPWVWAACGLWTFGKLYLWMWFCRNPVHWPLLLMIGLDSLASSWLWAIRLRGLAPQLTELHPFWRRWGTAASALAAPLLPFFLAGPFLASWLSRRVYWGGRVYEVYGRGRVTVARA